MKSLNKDINEIFKLINEELKKSYKHAKIVLIGGQLGLYHLGEDNYRETLDIDVNHMIMFGFVAVLTVSVFGYGLFHLINPGYFALQNF